MNVGKSANYDEAANAHLFVRGAVGGPPLVISWWKGKGSPIDFTKIDARQWLTNQLQKPIAESNIEPAPGRPESLRHRARRGDSRRHPLTKLALAAFATASSG